MKRGAESVKVLLFIVCRYGVIERLPEGLEIKKYKAEPFKCRSQQQVACNKKRQR